jgi:hypothetical protein
MKSNGIMSLMKSVKEWEGIEPMKIASQRAKRIEPGFGRPQTTDDRDCASFDSSELTLLSWGRATKPRFAGTGTVASGVTPETETPASTGVFRQKWLKMPAKWRLCFDLRQD